jgi:hypothetical protein
LRGNDLKGLLALLGGRELGGFGGGSGGIARCPRAEYLMRHSPATVTRVGTGHQRIGSLRILLGKFIADGPEGLNAELADRQLLRPGGGGFGVFLRPGAKDGQDGLLPVLDR